MKYSTVRFIVYEWHPNERKFSVAGEVDAPSAPHAINMIAKTDRDHYSRVDLVARVKGQHEISGIDMLFVNA